jgi:type I restriction enzyme M protein
LFYNTGISTYFWIVTNRKAPHRRGKVQLVDARSEWAKMRRSLGNKRKYLTSDHIAELVKLYGAFEENDRVKILDNEASGFLRITVERPLKLRWEINDDTLAAVQVDKKLAKLDEEDRRSLMARLKNAFMLRADSLDELVSYLGGDIASLGLTKAQTQAVWDALAVRDPDAPIVTNRKGEPQPDPELRDAENVPLPSKEVGYETDPTARLEAIEYRTAIADYMRDEVEPYIPDAWVDHARTRIGYEIPLTRHFYKYELPRPLEEIDEEIRRLEAEIQALLDEVTE